MTQNELEVYFNNSSSLGDDMHDMAKDLWPICRSITGEGVRETLSYIKRHIKELEIHSIPSGTKVFDWQIPDEWIIRSAYIEDKSGKKIIDMTKNNLHVVGYSEPIDEWMSLEKLNKYLYSLPDQPNAIPYITSYYERRWGFCLTHIQRQSLKQGEYHVVIDSEIKPGVLNYGEVIIPGLSKKEVMLSTYICHPSMANNELSGPVVTTMLAKWIASIKNRFYTYRIIFIPETIGSIAYLSENLEHLKGHVVAGYNITCVGDNRSYSFLPSRDGNTLSDRVALHVLKHIDPNFKIYTWLDRGSDERQFCSPGVDLPIASIMRSKYHEYPEYHTSLDDLSFVTADGLKGSFEAIRESIEIIEKNLVYAVKIICEPQLGRRGLYPTLSTKDHSETVKTMMDFLSYCDGTHDLLQISEIIDQKFESILPIVELLLENSIIEEVAYE
tara:strand:- start:312 stop:1637 length:1326 start_codon:yes stop_codon:yes gene_type:complete